MRKLIYITALLILISCQKQELSPFVEGQVIDKGNGQPIPGALLLLERNEFADNEEIFISDGTMYADAEGKFTLDRSAGYEFVSAQVEGYLDGPSYRRAITPESTISVELSGEAWLAIRVMNVGSKDSEDMLLVYPHFQDTSPFPFIFEGENVDSTIIGKVRAHEIWDIRWRTRHLGDHYWHLQQSVSSLSDTTLFIIAY